VASMPRASTFSYPARAHRSTKPKLKYSRKPGRSEEVPDLEPRADALRKQPSFWWRLQRESGSRVCGVSTKVG